MGTWGLQSLGGRPLLQFGAKPLPPPSYLPDPSSLSPGQDWPFSRHPQASERPPEACSLRTMSLL